MYSATIMEALSNARVSTWIENWWGRISPLDLSCCMRWMILALFTARISWFYIWLDNNTDCFVCGWLINESEQQWKICDQTLNSRYLSGVWLISSSNIRRVDDDQPCTDWLIFMDGHYVKIYRVACFIPTEGEVTDQGRAVHAGYLDLF